MLLRRESVYECCEVRFLPFACDRRVGCAAALAPNDPRSFAIAEVVGCVRDVPLNTSNERIPRSKLVVLADHRFDVAPAVTNFDVHPDACSTVCHAVLHRKHRAKR